MLFKKSSQSGLLITFCFIISFGCKNKITISGVNSTTADQICSGQVVAGVTGIGVCQSASGGTNAIAADVLAGKYFWDSTGTSVLGTMVASAGAFGDLIGSNMGRNVATWKMILKTYHLNDGQSLPFANAKS